MRHCRGAPPCGRPRKGSFPASPRLCPTSGGLPPTGLLFITKNFPLGKRGTKGVLAKTHSPKSPLPPFRKGGYQINFNTTKKGQEPQGFPAFNLSPSPLRGEGWDEGGFCSYDYPSPYPLPQGARGFLLFQPDNLCSRRKLNIVGEVHLRLFLRAQDQFPNR